MTAAARLARAAAATDIARLPGSLRTRVTDVVLDTLAVSIVGSDRPEHRRLRELLATGDGPATVLGSDRGAPASVAAFLNGTLPTVYQLDEGHRISRGHPAIHVVPAVLAVAEDRGSSTDDVLSAVLAGYEVAVRVGRALGGVRPDIHPHGNWPAIGAAAGAAWLLSAGDPAVIEPAIDGAASVAAAPDRAATTAGAGVHHLFAAVGAHTGVIAAAAAASGMDAVPGTLERFFGPRSGAAFAADPLVDGIGDDDTWSVHEIADEYVKFFPSCGHTHGELTAVASLLAREPFTADDVDRIDVRAYRASAALDATHVENELAARYSVPYTLAAAVLDGGFGLESLTAERLRDQRLHALAARVSVRHDPALDAGYPVSGRPVEVTVSLRDGRCLRADARYSDGDPEQPPDRDRLVGKLRSLIAHAWGDEAADRVLAAGLALAGNGTVGTLCSALRAGARPAAVPVGAR